MSNREAIDTFISITGASEAVAVQTLEEHGGDLNAAVNAHFGETDRNIRAPVHETSIAGQADFMDIDDPIYSEPLGQEPPSSLLSAAREMMNPFSLLDANASRSLFGRGSDRASRSPFVRHPREVREIPIEVKDGNQTSGRSRHAPAIEDVTGAEHELGPDIHGTVEIVDVDDENIPVAPIAQAAQKRERKDDVLGESSSDRNIKPSAPEFDHSPDDGNDIEEEMIRAVIEASKREAEESYPNERYGAQNYLSDPGLQRQKSPLDDTDLAHAVSLSLKTAEQEKALHEQGKSNSESEAVTPPQVEQGNVASPNGRLEIGSSSIQHEAEDLEQPPLVRRSSSHVSSVYVEPPKEVEFGEVSQSSSPGQPDTNNLPQHNGDPFHSDDWGGISSEEHDEAVMLEAAMFGGIPEGTGYHFPYASHQFMRNGGPHNRPVPRPPSPSLTAQRLIREQQDDEYLAALQVDREREMKAMREAEACREEERRKEEETHRRQQEEQELERQLAAKEASLPQEPASDDDNAMTLLVRMPDGSRHGRRFLKSNKLQSLFDFIDVGRVVKPGSYRLVRPYPRRAFSDGESNLTLNELGLTSKQEALFLELI